MLHLLDQYARVHNLVVEPGFAPKDVKWAVALDETGHFLEVEELGDTDSRKNTGRTFPTCPELSQPEMIGAGKGCRHFLIDSADVVALHWRARSTGPWLVDTEEFESLARRELPAGRSDDDPLLALARKHAFFADLILKATGEVPQLRAVAAVLCDVVSMRAVARRLAQLKTKPTDKVTFSVNGAFPVESTDWHHWWRSFRSNLGRQNQDPPDRTRPLRVCMVTGELVEPTPTHPKIVGLAGVGGMPMGDVLVSFDKEAFLSYGLEQGANGAVSAGTAASYRAALNHLLKYHSKRLANTVTTHWFAKSVPDDEDPLAWLEAGSDETELAAQRRASALLAAIRHGERPDLADNSYYGLTLSGAAGRAMVRDWMEGRFDSLVANVNAWFDDLAIVGREGAGLAKNPKFLAVVGSLARELGEVPPPLIARLWGVAVNREPIPESALAQALHRCRTAVIAGDPPNHARMGLLKAFNVRRGDHEMKPTLNETHPSPAYHCGRLMAVMAAIQYRALGDVGAGLVQRYYAAASATPALVLGRLARTSQFHLNKLDPGLSRWFDSKVAGVWAAIGDQIPTTLTLEEQSLFALGYYQQIAADRARPTATTMEETND